LGIDKKKSPAAAAAEPRHLAAEQLHADPVVYQARIKKDLQGLDLGLEAYQIELEVQNEELLRTQQELETQQIELEMQNEELQQAREEVEASRNKYTELYDFAPVAYFTFDARGVIQEVNLTGALMLGVERQLLTNKPFIGFMADASGREIFSGHLEAVLQSRSLQRCEIQLLGKGGAVIHGQLQSGTVDTPDNSRGYILSSIIDGTAGKQLEMEIKEAREYAENIVETVHNPLVVLGSDLKILTANQSFYVFFKVTPIETIGNFIYDLGNRQWDIPKLRVLFEQILPNDTVFNGYEVEHDFPGIGRKTILLNAREIFRKNIGSHIILLDMADITDRKQAEAERTRLEQVLQDKNTELERATFVAEKANQAKSDFLSSMSHELRTPLGAILGFAQLMESGTPLPTPDQKRSIDQILKAGWYLLALINEILDLALIESGKLSMSMEPVSLAEVMRECEVMIEPQAQKHGISVVFAPPASPSCFINVDRTRVKQVLINLLSNAIKYNSKGGTVTVESVLTSTEMVRINVRDTGAGLDPEQLAQLFQPFNRLGQEANVEGTGIGLVVCKRLVELMAGVIGVESVVGKGSVFWFELNRTDESPQHAAALAGVSTNVALAQGKGGAQVHTLLYVEDNPANLMLVEDIIARRPDIRFLSAVDAIRGIELAHAQLPDVILMDINLPGISGLEALKILAEDPATAHIPIVALSANAIPRDIDKGLEAGFFRYLTKPIQVTQFMETLDVALRYARMEAALAAVKKEQG
jgi:PAS domain S-box-containing protein